MKHCRRGRRATGSEYYVPLLLTPNRGNQARQAVFIILSWRNMNERPSAFTLGAVPHSTAARGRLCSMNFDHGAKSVRHLNKAQRHYRPLRRPLAGKVRRRSLLDRRTKHSSALNFAVMIALYLLLTQMWERGRNFLKTITFSARLNTAATQGTSTCQR